MTHPNETMVRRGFEAFGNADLATLSELLSEDVVHDVAGDNLVSGEHKGREAVFALYGKLYELSDGTVKVELQEVDVQGENRVVTQHRGTATRGEKSIDVTTTMVFTIEDGKVTRIDERFEDLDTVDSFWS